MSKTELEAAFDTQWLVLGGPLLESQYRFAAELVGPGKGLRERLQEAGLKDWRFDRAHLPTKVAIEMEGGVYLRGRRRGRHVRPQGFEDDCYKYNAATALGWRVFRLTTKMINDDPDNAIGPIIKFITDERMRGE